jgi:flagellar basal-body rod modification protein FlgD
VSINPTEGATAGLFVPPTSTDASSSTNLADKQTFLQLLVAQLRYQDPMNPTDSTEFMSQTAQFNALEQMQAVAQQTAALLSAQTAFGAMSLVGRNVGYVDADGATVTGTVSGVRYDAGGPVLTVDGTDIALGQVQSVTQGTTEPTQPTQPTQPTSGAGA